MKLPYLHSNKNIPQYILISLAIVQSEIYWLYSVLYYLCQESGLLNKPTYSVTTVKRRRSNSAPSKIKSVVNNSKEDNDEENQECQFSLPEDTVTMHIRERPTEKDELSGTTCPPIWWQKTRVKLGHAPVHGDPKPIKKPTFGSHNISPAATVTFANASTNSSIKQGHIISSSVHYITESPLSSPPLSPSDRISVTSPSLCLVNSFTSTSSSTDDVSIISTGSSEKPRKSRGKKILSKINAALHRHRKNDIK